MSNRDPHEKGTSVAIDHDAPLFPQTELRPPEKVMRLERMGSFFPTRLSFMRSLIRQLVREGSSATRTVWEVDADGYGHAVYTIQLGGQTYSLVAVSTQLLPENRTDRVIAEAWDSSYALFDGVPDKSDIERICENAPKQEAGRFEPSELVISRANKSVRLFEHVVERLASGQQPHEEMLASVGYLMRTTAVYGNGKFGIADRARFASRAGGMGEPFRAEMLTVWLIRHFTHDLVEHVARMRNPDDAVPLEQRLKRHLGIGNSTGLGMAPFLVSHPILINNWMQVRETALARVLTIKTADDQTIEKLKSLIQRVALHLSQWNVPDERQQSRIDLVRIEWGKIAKLTKADYFKKSSAFKALHKASEKYSIECQELIVALLIEPHGELVDGLTECMSSDKDSVFDPTMKAGQLLSHLKEQFNWALSVDYDTKKACHQFWYVSEEKLEPRLGNRHEEPGAELEQPLDVARRIKALNHDLETFADHALLAEFLLQYPQHRFAVRRAQTMLGFPYSEIRDNLIGKACLPIDMLRCKLSFFGASKFDPKSDRWTRITLYQGAPLSQDLEQGGARLSLEEADDWWLPVLQTANVGA